MKNITVRPAQPEDAMPYGEWLMEASKINLIDPAVYNYPTCNTAIVLKDGDPILGNSFHLTLTMEALAPRPGLSPMDEARALKALFDYVKQVAQASNVKEIWFGCSDERVIKFATRHGIEQVKFPMLRMKL